MVIIRGLATYRGKVGLIVVTAQGSDRLPWACTIEHHHDGRYGCRVEQGAADRNNESQDWRWAMLWKRVSNRLKLDGTVILAKAWEPQARGVGHLNLIVPLELVARVAGLLREMGPDYGFGFVDDGSRGRRRLRHDATGSDAAAYVASYIGDGGKVAEVLDAIREHVIPSRSFYVANQLTGVSGCTMRSLRLRRRAWAYLRGVCERPKWVELDEWVELVVEVAGSLGSRGPPHA